MIKVIQANCRASEDITTALMSAAVRAGAEVVLIQEPSVKKEEDKWKVKIRDGNYVSITVVIMTDHTC
jgi:glycine/D-amino acid oxidase-like deaminating enzyme